MDKKLQKKNEKITDDRRTEKLKETILFLTKLLILSIPMYIIIRYNVDFTIIRNFIAFHTSHFLNLVGIPSNFDVHGIIELKNSSIAINRDCTGWKGMWFFMALILSTKASIRKKITGIAVGTLNVLSVNILRIVVMIWVEINLRGMFTIIHDILWQASIIFIVLILWYIWLNQSIAN